jgi:hypothetical protein
MSPSCENRVRLVCLGSLLAAAALLAGCRDSDLPMGSVDSSASGGGGTSSGGGGGNAAGGSGGVSSGSGGAASGGSGGEASGGREGSGSPDGGSVPSCSGDTKSPKTDDCTPAKIEQDMDSCTRCGDIGYIWDGTTCKDIGGCACLEGCERIFKTKEECTTAHLGCPKR